MRNHITFPRVVIALALLSAISREDYAPLVDLIAFSAALLLFVIAPLSVLAVLLTPFAAAIGMWRHVVHRRANRARRTMSSCRKGGC